MIALPNCQEAVVPWICGPNFVTFSGHQVEHFLFLQGLIESRKDSLWKSQVVTVGLGFPSGSDSKESTCNLGDSGSIPGLGRSPGGGHGNPLQCSCLENPHGQMSLVGYSPWGRKESDRTEWLIQQQPLLARPQLGIGSSWCLFFCSQPLETLGIFCNNGSQV